MISRQAVHLLHKDTPKTSTGGTVGTQFAVRRLNVIYYLAHIPILAYAVVFFIINMALLVHQAA